MPVWEIEFHLWCPLMCPNTYGEKIHVILCKNDFQNVHVKGLGVNIDDSLKTSVVVKFTN